MWQLPAGMGEGRRSRAYKVFHTFNITYINITRRISQSYRNIIKNKK